MKISICIWIDFSFGNKRRGKSKFSKDHDLQISERILNKKRRYL